MRACFYHFFLCCTILWNYSCTDVISGGAEVSTGSSSIVIPSHVGQWSSCIDYDSDADGVSDKSIQQLLTFTTSTLIDSKTYFTSVSCEIVDHSYKLESVYKYTQSGSLFNFKLRAYVYTPLSIEKTNTNNSTKWCSLISWVVNSPISILGENCGGTTRNYDESSSTTVNVSGNDLQFGGVIYSLELRPDFSETSNPIPDGSYIYINGDERAQMLILQDKSYTLYHYDLENHYYMIESGTYTSKNNLVTLNIASTNPIYCQSGAKTYSFRAASDSMMINFTPESDLFIGLKVPFNEQQFRSLYLGGGFGIWCI